MNDVELAEHRMLVAMFIDSHRPDRRYMSRENFDEYSVKVEPKLFQSIVTRLKEQGIVKTRTDGGVRLHGDKHADALSRILAATGSEGFSVDWDTKRVMFDEGVADELVPTPIHWMLLGAVRKPKAPIAAAPAKAAPASPKRVSVVSTDQSSGREQMSWIARYATVWQTRIALGVVFAGAIIAGLWPDHARDVDPVKLIACIVAGLAWLAAEFASVTAKASAHDIALFARINGVLNDNAMTFLLEHDFGHDLHSSQTKPIAEIADWHGPNYVFNDKRVQRRWKALFDKIVALANAYGETLSPGDRPEILTAWLHGYTRHNQPQKARDDVKALNDAASTVYKDFHEFALFARKRLDL